MPAKILAFSGSTRAASYNRQAVQLAARLAREAGAEVTALDLKDYPLPIYDGDLEAEQGAPDNALALHDLFCVHDAFLIASPEYNGSVSALLKNTIDWVTRPREGHAPLDGFTGKVAGIMSASPGGLGGLRGLGQLRTILGNIGVLVLPEQVAIASAHSAFDDAGQLADEAIAGRMNSLVQRVVGTTEKLKTD